MRYVLLAIMVATMLSAGYFFYTRSGAQDADIMEGSPGNLEFPAIKDIGTDQQMASRSAIDVEYLRSLNIDAPAPVIEEELTPGTNYRRYIASYTSEGNKIYGLLTVPSTDAPENGFPSIIFNHGYIPPSQYSTTEKYVAYVDYLARSGFIVFKIDLRGNGQSEGSPTGSYFSPGYTIDAISAAKSLQKFSDADPNRIGIWGHSMAGNLALRAMLVSDVFKAGAIWAGAVYSYKDFSEYGLNDTSYVGRRRPDRPDPEDDERRLDSERVAQLRENPETIDWNDSFWSGISLTSNISYISGPLSLHHAVDDPVVNIGYSRDLAEVMETGNIEYELNEYPGGGHNINSPYFETAMQRTVEFFRDNL